MKTPMRAAGLLLVSVAMSGCGIMRQAQYADAGNTLDVHPAGTKELEPRRVHTGPQESTWSNIWVPDQDVRLWDWYLNAYRAKGWSFDPTSQPADKTGYVTLKLTRGFEHVWVQIQSGFSGKSQVQQMFYVKQPGDDLSMLLQAGWDSLFKWLPPENPVRKAGWIF